MKIIFILLNFVKKKMEKEIDDIKENLMPEQSDDDNIIMSQKSKNTVLSEASQDYTIENFPRITLNVIKA